MATSTEACASYVSMLRARRLEDERTRKRRGERRADVLNDNVDRYKSRERRVREKLMRLKLKSLSRVEGDLFDMLEEQAQWRHVMRENVQHRERQQKEIETAQAQHREVHLTHALQQEVDAFGVAVKDDEARWNAVRTQRQTERASANEELCGAVMDSIVDLAADVVGYIDSMSLLTGANLGGAEDPAAPEPVAAAAAPSSPSSPTQGRPASAKGGNASANNVVESAGPSPVKIRPVPRPATAFDLVPPPVFEAMKLDAVYGADEEAKRRRVLEEHATLRSVAVDATTETGAQSMAYSGVLGHLTQRLEAIVNPPPQSLRPKETNPKAFIVLSGPKYSGKSAAARAAADEYGLEYASDVSIVDECLSALEGDITSADLESAVMCDRLTLAREIRCRLQDGSGLDDALLAQLVLFKIRTVSTDAPGIVFDGIPRTREAFEAVEATLSGYTPDWDAVKPRNLLTLDGTLPADFDVNVLEVERPPPPPPEPVPTGKEAKKAEKAPAKKDKKKDEPEEPLPPVVLPEVEPVPPLTEEEEATLTAASTDVNIAGLQRVVRIECDPKQLFERYCGHRMDAETGEQYHVTTNPPPLERMPFLVAKDRSEGDTAKMHAAIESDAETWAGVKPFLATYVGLLDTVEGNVPLEELVSAVREVVAGAVNTAQKEFETVETAAAIRDQRAELETLQRERLEHREAVRKQLHQIYTERGVDPLPAELAEPPKPAESPFLPMPEAVPAAALRILADFEGHYRDVVYRVHRELGRMMQSLLENGVWTMQEFRDFCARPDGKQRHVDAFIKDMNAMPPALRSDTQCKDELHLRADGLWDALTAIVDKRREDGTALVDTLLAPAAFLDQWNEGVRFLGTTLMQLEVERLQVVRQVASVYYGGIKGEPIAPEDPEAAIDLVALPKGADAGNDAPPPGPGKGGKDAKGKPAPKKGAAAAPPPPEEPKTPEDYVAPIVEKANAYARTMIDKLAAPPQPVAAPTGKGKGAKAAAEAAPPVDVNTVAKLSLPLMTSEAEAAQHRITEVGRFLAALLRRGVDRNAGVRSHLQTQLSERVVGEMSAVNGALLFLRSAVEEEAPLQFAVVLEGTAFRVDGGRALGPLAAASGNEAGQQASGSPSRSALARSQSPTSPQIQSPHAPGLDGSLCASDLGDSETRLTSALTPARMSAMISLFRAVAPDYAIHREDFCRVVSLHDWTVGGGDVAAAAPADVVFRRFDSAEGGAIDWREFVVHLLLWCEPLSATGAGNANASSAFAASPMRNPYYIDGPTLVQLFDLKSDLGVAPLDRDQFMETELYFEVQMETPRLIACKEALWDTFAVDEALDPNELVMFLCADEQPLRGVQKAFAMAAEVGDDVCALTVDMMYRMFHFNACNYASFGIDDRYSYEELQVLFEQAGIDAVSFQDMCAIGMGRILLNNTACFRKRRFTAK